MMDNNSNDGKKPMSAAQIRAQKRRERILKKSSERMALVNGTTKSLKEPEEKAVEEDYHTEGILGIDAKQLQTVEVDVNGDEPSAELSPAPPVPKAPKSLTWEEKRKRALEKTFDDKTLSKAEDLFKTIEQPVNESEIRERKSRILTDENFTYNPPVQKNEIKGNNLVAMEKAHAAMIFFQLRLITSVFLGYFLAYMALYTSERVTQIDLKLGTSLMDSFGYHSEINVAAAFSGFSDDSETEINLNKNKPIGDPILGPSKWDRVSPGFTFKELYFGSSDYVYLPLSLMVLLMDLVLIVSVKSIFWKVNPSLLSTVEEERGFILTAAIAMGGNPVKRFLSVVEFMMIWLSDLILTFFVFVFAVAVGVIRAQNIEYQKPL